MSKTISVDNFELKWDNSEIYYRVYCEVPDQIGKIHGFDDDRFDLYVSTDGISAAASKSYTSADEETLRECVTAYNDRKNDKGKKPNRVFGTFSYQGDGSAAVRSYFGLAPKERSATEVAVPWGLPRSQWGECAMNGVATFALPSEKINDTKVFGTENYQTDGCYYYLRHCFLDNNKQLHGVAIVLRKKIVQALREKKKEIIEALKSQIAIENVITSILNSAEELKGFGYKSTSVFLLSDGTKTSA